MANVKRPIEQWENAEGTDLEATKGTGAQPRHGFQAHRTTELLTPTCATRPVEATRETDLEATKDPEDPTPSTESKPPAFVSLDTSP